MTIPGVDATVALSIVAAVGDFRRFRRPEQLVVLSRAEPAGPSVRRPARHARADHQAGSRARARDARRGRVERGQDPRAAARVLRARPRPPRDADRDRRDRPQARVPVLDDDRARRGLRVRAPVADRRRSCARSSCAPGMPSRRGQKGDAAAYSLKEVRRRELELAEQAEHAYRQHVADWQAKARAAKPGVAAANGTRLKRPSAGQAARQASVPEPALRSGVDHAHTEA